MDAELLLVVELEVGPEIEVLCHLGLPESERMARKARTALGRARTSP